MKKIQKSSMNLVKKLFLGKEKPHFQRSAVWQAAPIKISAVFLVFSMVSAFFGKIFGACCFILLVATVQPKKILWDLWNFVRSARFCQRSPL